MRTIILWWTRIALLALLLAAGSLPAAGQELQRSFVGRITGAEGSDALIAVVVAPDGKTIAYVCSKDNAWNEENSRWYSGQMTNQGVINAATRDGKQLSGTVYGDSLRGTVGGLNFTADLVTVGTAGLFRGTIGDETHAVIEAPDGTRVGGVWNAASGRWAWTWSFVPATPVERTGPDLRVQRPADAPALAVTAGGAATAQQFVFVELKNCVSSFDSCV